MHCLQTILSILSANVITHCPREMGNPKLQAERDRWDCRSQWDSRSNLQQCWQASLAVLAYLHNWGTGVVIRAGLMSPTMTMAISREAALHTAPQQELKMHHDKNWKRTDLIYGHTNSSQTHFTPQFLILLSLTLTHYGARVTSSWSMFTSVWSMCHTCTPTFAENKGGRDTEKP